MISVNKLREMYPSGTKVKLIRMNGELQMPQGLIGTVHFVDDAGQIHVNWENGSSLALLEEDEFVVME